MSHSSNWRSNKDESHPSSSFPARPSLKAPPSAFEEKIAQKEFEEILDSLLSEASEAGTSNTAELGERSRLPSLLLSRLSVALHAAYKRHGVLRAEVANIVANAQSAGCVVSVTPNNRRAALIRQRTYSNASSAFNNGGAPPSSFTSIGVSNTINSGSNSSNANNVLSQHPLRIPTLTDEYAKPHSNGEQASSKERGFFQSHPEGTRASPRDEQQERIPGVQIEDTGVPTGAPLTFPATPFDRQDEEFNLARTLSEVSAASAGSLGANNCSMSSTTTTTQQSNGAQQQHQFLELQKGLRASRVDGAFSAWRGPLPTRDESSVTPLRIGCLSSTSALSTVPPIIKASSPPSSQRFNHHRPSPSSTCMPRGSPDKRSTHPTGRVKRGLSSAGGEGALVLISSEGASRRSPQTHSEVSFGARSVVSFMSGNKRTKGTNGALFAEAVGASEDGLVVEGQEDGGAAASFSPLAALDALWAEVDVMAPINECVSALGKKLYEKEASLGESVALSLGSIERLEKDDRSLTVPLTSSVGGLLGGADGDGSGNALTTFIGMAESPVSMVGYLQRQLHEKQSQLDFLVAKLNKRTEIMSHIRQTLLKELFILKARNIGAHEVPAFTFFNVIDIVENAQELEVATEALRSEFEAASKAHQSFIESLQSDYHARRLQLTREHDLEVEALRAAMKERSEGHALEIDRLKARHADALAAVVAERDAYAGQCESLKSSLKQMRLRNMNTKQTAGSALMTGGVGGGEREKATERGLPAGRRPSIQRAKPVVMPSRDGDEGKSEDPTFPGEGTGAAKVKGKGTRKLLSPAREGATTSSTPPPSRKGSQAVLTINVDKKGSSATLSRRSSSVPGNNDSSGRRGTISPNSSPNSILPAKKDYSEEIRAPTVDERRNSSSLSHGEDAHAIDSTMRERLSMLDHTLSGPSSSTPLSTLPAYSSSVAVGVGGMPRPGSATIGPSGARGSLRGLMGAVGRRGSETQHRLAGQYDEHTVGGLFVPPPPRAEVIDPLHAHTYTNRSPDLSSEDEFGTLETAREIIEVGEKHDFRKGTKREAWIRGAGAEKRPFAAFACVARVVGDLAFRMANAYGYRVVDVRVEADADEAERGRGDVVSEEGDLDLDSRLGVVTVMFESVQQAVDGATHVLMVDADVLVAAIHEPCDFTFVMRNAGNRLLPQKVNNTREPSGVDVRSCLFVASRHIDVGLRVALKAAIDTAISLNKPCLAVLGDISTERLRNKMKAEVLSASPSCCRLSKKTSSTLFVGCDADGGKTLSDGQMQALECAMLDEVRWMSHDDHLFAREGAVTDGHLPVITPARLSYLFAGGSHYEFACLISIGRLFSGVDLSSADRSLGDNNADKDDGDDWVVILERLADFAFVFGDELVVLGCYEGRLLVATLSTEHAERFVGALVNQSESLLRVQADSAKTRPREEGKAKANINSLPLMVAVCVCKPFEVQRSLLYHAYGSVVSPSASGGELYELLYTDFGVKGRFGNMLLTCHIAASSLASGEGGADAVTLMAHALANPRPPPASPPPNGSDEGVTKSRKKKESFSVSTSYAKTRGGGMRVAEVIFRTMVDSADSPAAADAPFKEWCIDEGFCPPPTALTPPQPYFAPFAVETPHSCTVVYLATVMTAEPLLFDTGDWVNKGARAKDGGTETSATLLSTLPFSCTSTVLYEQALQRFVASNQTSPSWLFFVDAWVRAPSTQGVAVLGVEGLARDVTTLSKTHFSMAHVIASTDPTHLLKLVRGLAEEVTTVPLRIAVDVQSPHAVDSRNFAVTTLPLASAAAVGNPNPAMVTILPSRLIENPSFGVWGSNATESKGGGLVEVLSSVPSLKGTSLVVVRHAGSRGKARTSEKDSGINAHMYEDGAWLEEVSEIFVGTEERASSASIERGGDDDCPLALISIPFNINKKSPQSLSYQNTTEDTISRRGERVPQRRVFVPRARIDREVRVGGEVFFIGFLTPLVERFGWAALHCRLAYCCKLFGRQTLEFERTSTARESSLPLFGSSLNSRARASELLMGRSSVTLLSSSTTGGGAAEDSFTPKPPIRVEIEVAHHGEAVQAIENVSLVVLMVKFNGGRPQISDFTRWVEAVLKKELCPLGGRIVIDFSPSCVPFVESSLLRGDRQGIISTSLYSSFSYSASGAEHQKWNGFNKRTLYPTARRLGYCVGHTALVSDVVVFLCVTEQGDEVSIYTNEARNALEASRFAPRSGKEEELPPKIKSEDTKRNAATQKEDTFFLFPLRAERAVTLLANGGEAMNMMKPIRRRSSHRFRHTKRSEESLVRLYSFRAPQRGVDPMGNNQRERLVSILLHENLLDKVLPPLCAHPFEWPALVQMGGVRRKSSSSPSILSDSASAHEGVDVHLSGVVLKNTGSASRTHNASSHHHGWDGVLLSSSALLDGTVYILSPNSVNGTSTTGEEQRSANCLPFLSFSANKRHHTTSSNFSSPSTYKTSECPLVRLLSLETDFVETVIDLVPAFGATHSIVTQRAAPIGKRKIPPLHVFLEGSPSSGYRVSRSLVTNDRLLAAGLAFNQNGTSSDSLLGSAASSSFFVPTALNGISDFNTIDPQYVPSGPNTFCVALSPHVSLLAPQGGEQETAFLLVFMLIAMGVAPRYRGVVVSPHFSPGSSCAKDGATDSQNNNDGLFSRVYFGKTTREACTYESGLYESSTEKKDLRKEKSFLAAKQTSDEATAVSHKMGTGLHKRRGSSLSLAGGSKLVHVEHQRYNNSGSPSLLFAFESSTDACDFALEATEQLQRYLGNRFMATQSSRTSFRSSSTSSSIRLSTHRRPSNLEPASALPSCLVPGSGPSVVTALMFCEGVFCDYNQQTGSKSIFSGSCVVAGPSAQEAAIAAGKVHPTFPAGYFIATHDSIRDVEKSLLDRFEVTQIALDRSSSTSFPSSLPSLLQHSHFKLMSKKGTPNSNGLSTSFFFVDGTPSSRQDVKKAVGQQSRGPNRGVNAAADRMIDDIDNEPFRGTPATCSVRRTVEHCALMTFVSPVNSFPASARGCLLQVLNSDAAVDGGADSLLLSRPNRSDLSFIAAGSRSASSVREGTLQTARHGGLRWSDLFCLYECQEVRPRALSVACLEDALSGTVSLAPKTYCLQIAVIPSKQNSNNMLAGAIEDNRLVSDSGILATIAKAVAGCGASLVLLSPHIPVATVEFTTVAAVAVGDERQAYPTEARHFMLPHVKLLCHDAAFHSALLFRFSDTVSEQLPPAPVIVTVLNSGDRTVKGLRLGNHVRLTYPRKAHLNISLSSSRLAAVLSEVTSSAWRWGRSAYQCLRPLSASLLPSPSYRSSPPKRQHGDKGGITSDPDTLLFHRCILFVPTGTFGCYLLRSLLDVCEVCPVNVRPSHHYSSRGEEGREGLELEKREENHGFSAYLIAPRTSVFNFIGDQSKASTEASGTASFLSPHRWWANAVRLLAMQGPGGREEGEAHASSVAAPDATHRWVAFLCDGDVASRHDVVTLTEGSTPSIILSHKVIASVSAIAQSQLKVRAGATTTRRENNTAELFAIVGRDADGRRAVEDALNTNTFNTTSTSDTEKVASAVYKGRCRLLPAPIIDARPLPHRDLGGDEQVYNVVRTPTLTAAHQLDAKGNISVDEAQPIVASLTLRARGPVVLPSSPLPAGLVGYLSATVQCTEVKQQAAVWTACLTLLSSLSGATVVGAERSGGDVVRWLVAMHTAVELDDIADGLSEAARAFSYTSIALINFIRSTECWFKLDTRHELCFPDPTLLNVGASKSEGGGEGRGSLNTRQANSTASSAGDDESMAVPFATTNNTYGMGLNVLGQTLDCEDFWSSLAESPAAASYIRVRPTGRTHKESAEPVGGGEEGEGLSGGTVRNGGSSDGIVTVKGDVAHLRVADDGATPLDADVVETDTVCEMKSSSSPVTRRRVLEIGIVEDESIADDNGKHLSNKSRDEAYSLAARFVEAYSCPSQSAQSNSDGGHVGEDLPFAGFTSQSARGNGQGVFDVTERMHTERDAPASPSRSRRPVGGSSFAASQRRSSLTLPEIDTLSFLRNSPTRGSGNAGVAADAAGEEVSDLDEGDHVCTSTTEEESASPDTFVSNSKRARAHSWVQCEIMPSVHRAALGSSSFTSLLPVANRNETRDAWTQWEDCPEKTDWRASTPTPAPRRQSAPVVGNASGRGAGRADLSFSLVPETGLRGQEPDEANVSVAAVGRSKTRPSTASKVMVHVLTTETHTRLAGSPRGNSTTGTAIHGTWHMSPVAPRLPSHEYAKGYVRQTLSSRRPPTASIDRPPLAPSSASTDPE